MATFPGGIASLTNPTASSKMNAVSHAAQHINANDEIEAIETALGVDLANVVLAAAIDTDTTLSAESDVKVPSQKAIKTYADNMVLTGGGIPLGYLDTDGTAAANSDTRVPSQKAMVTYVAAEIADIPAPTIPVKATGAEIDTGTDDAKFATAKAIADSGLLNGSVGVVGSPVSKTVGTIYQAETDGIVCSTLVAADGTSATRIEGFSDSNSNPVLRLGASDVGPNRPSYSSISFPVSKGNYYKIIKTTESGTECSPSMRFIPIA